MRKDVGELAGVSLPTVDRWVQRYERFGLAGFEEHKRAVGVSRCRLGCGRGSWR